MQQQSTQQQPPQQQPPQSMPAGRSDRRNAAVVGEIARQDMLSSSIHSTKLTLIVVLCRTLTLKTKIAELYALKIDCNNLNHL